MDSRPRVHNPREGTGVRSRYTWRYPTHPAPEPWHETVFGYFREWLERDPVRRYVAVDDPADAALILYFELTQPHTLEYVQGILDEPLRGRYPNKFVTFNQHWNPAGFLPGVYTGLPRDRIDPSVHRPWGFLFLANGLVTREQADDIEPTLLYSFRGANSHVVREKILTEPVPPGMHASVRHIDRWFDHTDEEKASYVDELRRSKFVLCPRGLGPSSHRLFETMAVGRCPVILSDAWVSIPGIDWEACAIRVPESDVNELPRILQGRERDAARLGSRARRIWRDTFSPANGPRAMIDVCHQLVREHHEDWGAPDFVRRWLDPSRLARPGDTTEADALRRLSRRIDPQR